MSDEDLTVRDALEASFVDSDDSPGGGDAPEAPAPETPAPEVPADSPAEVPETTEVPSDTPQRPAAPAKPDLIPPDKPVVTPQTALKPPSSWKPEVQGLFKELPAQVQREVLRRERDMARFVQETGDIRQHFDNFISICQPYQGLIALDGGDPLKTFGEFLRTGAILRLGTPAEKANAIAMAVRQFEVDVGNLDTALAALYNGQPLPQQQQQQPLYDPRVDQILGHIQQSEAQREAQLEQTQLAEIESFRSDPKNEHFEALRPDIADLLEFNALRGKRMTLAQAYQQAASMNPQVSKAMARKAATTSANRNRQLIAGKRMATTTPPGAPIPATANLDNATLRQSLSAAWDAHAQQV